MPIIVDWYQNTTTIEIRCSEHVSLDDLQALATQLRRMIRTQTSPVQIIAHVTEMKSYPKNIAAIRDGLADVAQVRTSIRALMVIAEQSSLKRFVISLVAQLVLPKVPFRFANTLDQALSYLGTLDMESA